MHNVCTIKLLMLEKLSFNYAGITHKITCDDVSAIIFHKITTVYALGLTAEPT